MMRERVIGVAESTSSKQGSANVVCLARTDSERSEGQHRDERAKIDAVTLEQTKEHKPHDHRRTIIQKGLACGRAQKEPRGACDGLSCG
eukprot:2033163-Prymnesium_polylepis.1